MPSAFQAIFCLKPNASARQPLVLREQGRLAAARCAPQLCCRRLEGLLVLLGQLEGQHRFAQLLRLRVQLGGGDVVGPAPAAALLQALNAAVCGHPTVTDEQDLKTRITCLNRYRIGLDGTGRAFVHVQLHLLSGRSAQTKRELSKRIAAVLKAQIPPQNGLHVQLSADIADMDRDAYFKGRL